MPTINFQTFLGQKEHLAWKQDVSWSHGAGAVRHLIWKGYFVENGRATDIPLYFAYVTVDDKSGNVGVALAANVRFDVRGRGQQVIDKFSVGNKNNISDNFLVDVMRQRYGLTELDFSKTPVAPRVGAGKWVENSKVSENVLIRKTMYSKEDNLLVLVFLNKTNYSRGPSQYKVNAVIVSANTGLKDSNNYRSHSPVFTAKEGMEDFDRTVRQFHKAGFTNEVVIPEGATSSTWDFDVGASMEVSNKIKDAFDAAISSAGSYSDEDLLNDPIEESLNDFFKSSSVGRKKTAQDTSTYYNGPLPSAEQLTQYVGTSSVESSQIKGIFSGVDEAISLVNQFDSSLLLNVAFIYNVTGGSAYGVYMSALDNQIKEAALKKLMKMDGYQIQDMPNGAFYATHKDKDKTKIDQEIEAYRKKVETSGITTFGIDMNRVIGAARADASEGNISDPQDQYLLGVMHLGATMVHEAIHSKGAQQEGPSENAENMFMQWVMPIINQRRQQRYQGSGREEEYAPLVIQTGTRRMASSNWLEKAAADGCVGSVPKRTRWDDPKLPELKVEILGVDEQNKYWHVKGTGDLLKAVYSYATGDDCGKTKGSDIIRNTKILTDFPPNVTPKKMGCENGKVWKSMMPVDYDPDKEASSSVGLAKKAQYGAQFLHNQEYVKRFGPTPWSTAYWNFGVGAVETMLDRVRPTPAPPSQLSFEGQLRQHQQSHWTNEVDATTSTEELLEPSRMAFQAYRSTEALIEDSRERPFMLPVKAMKKQAWSGSPSYDSGKDAFGWMSNLDIPMEDRIQPFDNNDEETTWFDKKFIRNQPRYNPEYGNPMSKEDGIYAWWVDPKLQIEKFDEMVANRPSMTSPASRFANDTSSVRSFVAILECALKSIVRGKILGTRFVCPQHIVPFINKFFENDADIRVETFGDGPVAAWVASAKISREDLEACERYVRGDSDSYDDRKIFENITNMPKIRSESMSTMIEAVQSATRDAGIDMFIVGDLPLAVKTGVNWDAVRTVDFCSDDPDGCMKIGEIVCENLGADSQTYTPFERNGNVVVAQYGCVTFRFLGGQPTDSCVEAANAAGVEPTFTNCEIIGRQLTPLMLAMNVLTEEVVDPTGEAMPDVEAKVVRTAAYPDDAIRLNPLSIVDAVFIASVFDFAIDSDFSDAAAKAKMENSDAKYVWDVIRSVGKGKCLAVAEQYGMDESFSSMIKE